MGRFGEIPEVEDLTEQGSTEGPRQRAVIVAGVAVVLVLVVMVVLSPGTEEPAPSSTSLGVLERFSTVPPPSAVTSTSPASPTAPEGEITALPLRDVFPGFEGTLMASVGGSRLLRWPYLLPARFTDVSGLWQGSLGFDASGQQMAFLASSASTEDAALYVGRNDRWAPARIGVGSFRWHATVPGRIGWIERGDEPRLCSADVNLDDGLPTPTCVVAAADGTLVGFDDSGFLLTDGLARSVHRLDLAGEMVATATGFDAIVGPDARVLIVDWDADDLKTFTLTSPDLSEAVALEWAPADATGEIAFVAWSPSPSGPDLAFITYEGRRGRLELWTLSGELVEAIDVAGRVWNVEWDSTGRYVVVPGIIDETDKVLYVYDTFDSTLLTLPFDEFVVDAHMVTPAACDKAERVTDVLAGKLPTGVTLATARMALSRDARLESWYFISARVAGGGFDGELATWAFPGFDGRTVDDVNTPNLVVPINQAASEWGFGMTLDPRWYGSDDWYTIDGATISEYCVRQAENE